MKTGSQLSRNGGTRGNGGDVRQASSEGGLIELRAQSDALDRVEPGAAMGQARAGISLERIPEGVRASVSPGIGGVYDARRLRSQREIIRDVMLAAADCETWLTLAELRALTRYGEASISAQLRHLRKLENGGYEISKRHRGDPGAARAGVDGRGECVWEYRIARGERVRAAA